MRLAEGPVGLGLGTLDYSYGLLDFGDKQSTYFEQRLFFKVFNSIHTVIRAGDVCRITLYNIIIIYNI